MQQRNLELAVGLFMAIGLGALLMLALQVSDLGTSVGKDGYRIEARFDNIGQLKTRAAVKMSGVAIGQVVDIHVDHATFDAVVVMQIDRRFNDIPVDTSAQIFTSGMLGEQYIALQPGGEETFLAEGDTITLTQPALVLEQLIGQFMMSKASGDAE
jgi:phospholipid/cholesterol/gamma-HCH transport system substrate-binding protein